MKNEQPKNAGQPKTVSVAAGNYMSTDNGMPSSEEMEQAVVLAILTQSTAICEVGNRLRPEMFTNPAYCLVYRAMLALYQHEADIDMLSVEREMRRIDPEHATQLNGLAFIADGMLKVRNARFIKTYAAWVIRCWVLRQAIAGMTARMVEAREPGVDVMAWLNASRKDLEKLEDEFAVHSTTRTAAEVGDRVLAEIYDEQERRRAGEQLQITTGIDEFDHYLGGLYRGELLVLAGRPSMGKTALALHMALAAAQQGKKVCFFSLEMTERQLISRLLCTLSGVEPDKRVFLLTRSGFAGLQRYSTATWSGDIATRWEDMKAQISAGLNFAVSGIPYWTMDIGGFCVENRYVAGQMEFNKTGRENADYKEWRELNTRWYQFGAFCPLFRAHGQYPYREVWNIAPAGHPCYNSIVYYTKLRYNMMPYIYSLAGMTYFNDYTIMRPLVMDFTADANVNNIGDQFMFGSALMVAPVYEYGARSREVYFPASCGWYDFYSGKYVDGGQKLTVDAPYERIPLYVCEGAIVPYGPDMQYSDEKPASEITLYVYTGKDGAFTLYEDEGVNYNYEKGQYATIPFAYNDAEGTLVIGDRTGDFPGMLKERTFNVVKVSKDRPQPFDLKAKGTTVKYDGKAQTVKL